MTTVVISQPMLLPWVGMFEQMKLADVYVHYDDVQFSKGSFTNRVQVKTAAGLKWMTVPLDKRAGSGVTIEELRADDSSDWRQSHLRLLRDAYGGVIFGDEMLELAAELYASTRRSLCDWLIEGMELVAGRLSVTDGTAIHRSSQLGIGGSGWERVLQVVQHLGGDRYVTGHGARNYLDAEAFEAAGVEVVFMDYARVPAPQLHGEFTPFVTILDLLANTGKAAAEYLEPRTIPWRDFLAAE